MVLISGETAGSRNQTSICSIGLLWRRRRSLRLCEPLSLFSLLTSLFSLLTSAFNLHSSAFTQVNAPVYLPPAHFPHFTPAIQGRNPFWRKLLRLIYGEIYFSEGERSCNTKNRMSRTRSGGIPAPQSSWVTCEPKYGRDAASTLAIYYIVICKPHHKVVLHDINHNKLCFHSKIALKKTFRNVKKCQKKQKKDEKMAQFVLYWCYFVTKYMEIPGWLQNLPSLI